MFKPNPSLEKVIKKRGLKYDQAVRMIVQHHLLEKIIPKSQLKKIHINIKDPNSLKLVTKAAKALKISEDAVICTLLHDYMDTHNGEAVK